MRSELYLSRGVSTYDEEVCSVCPNGVDVCGGNCFICSKAYRKYMLPIVLEQAQKFLRSALFANKYRINELTFKNMDEVPNILWGSKDWIQDIFGKKTVCQYNVFSVFFQLIATKILSIDYEGNDGVRFVLTRGQQDQFLYEDVSAWKGFEFRGAERGSNLLSFADISRN